MPLSCECVEFAWIALQYLPVAPIQFPFQDLMVSGLSQGNERKPNLYPCQLYRRQWHSQSFTLFLVHLITHKTIPLSLAKQAEEGQWQIHQRCLPSQSPLPWLPGPVCHSGYTNSKHPLSVLLCLRPVPPTTRGSGCQTQHTSGTGLRRSHANLLTLPNITCY